ncbi:MAG: peptidylprolyl isomerase [Caldilineaceae bacterium]|nr:peptidylprolyl isomerase [Caldilineaceae bacterium]
MFSVPRRKPTTAEDLSRNQGSPDNLSSASLGWAGRVRLSNFAARFTRRPGYLAVLILLLILLVISSCTAPTGATGDSQEVEEGAAAALEPADRNGMYDDSPAMTIDPNVEYHAVFKTEKGDMRVKLFAEEAPVTVNNFVFLARDGFYNDTHFHRVLQDFMAQGGDPTNTGAGGPGYQFQDETVAGLQFDRAGLLAMANAGPNTNGSQFFITFAETPWLNGNHTIFGEVVDGMDVLFSLSLRDPRAADSPGDLLKTVEIEEDE